jgi:hypothetical protein
MSAQWREEQNRCLREIERHEAAEQSYMDEGVQILELARNAQRLFEQQQPREKRRLLNFVLSNCSWEEAKWLPPSVNRLIYWRKPLLSQRALRRVQTLIRQNQRFGAFLNTVRTERVLSRFVLELGDAISCISRVPSQAARSIG